MISGRLACALAALAALAVAGCSTAPSLQTVPSTQPSRAAVAVPQAILNPLAIDAMRQRDYPGSDLMIEQTLAAGAGYQRFIASYRSDGLKIFGLLTVPNGARPARGWPVIIFNHGYIPPQQYKTTERYVAYVDGFARNGYIVFKSDYRGNGSSEGDSQTSYYSPGYTIDVLNALESMKKFKIHSINSAI